jgi:hypothetical protein
MGRERGWVSVSVRTYHSHRSQQNQQNQRVMQQDYTVDESGATLNAVSRSSDLREEERIMAQMAAASNTNQPTTSIFIRDWKVRTSARVLEGRGCLRLGAGAGRTGHGLGALISPFAACRAPLASRLSHLWLRWAARQACPQLVNALALFFTTPRASRRVRAPRALAAVWPARPHSVRARRQLLLVQPRGRRASAEQQHAWVSM